MRIVLPASCRPSRAALLAAVLLIAAAPAAAQDVSAGDAPASSEPSAATVDGALTPEPVTVLGTGVLQEAELVVRVRLDRVQPLSPGVSMGSFTVLERLHGPASGPRVQVLSNEAGYFDGVPVEAIAFLARLPRSTRWRSLGTVAVADRDGSQRLAAVRRSLAIERLPANEKAVRLRQAAFEALADAGTWTRRNAGREIAHLAALRPEVFSLEDLRDLRGRAARSPDPDLRPLLAEAADHLEAAARSGRLAGEGGGRVSLRSAPWVRILREDEEAERRAEAATMLGRRGEAGDLVALVEALAAEPEAAVRGAVVRALEAALLATAPPPGEPAPPAALSPEDAASADTEPSSRAVVVAALLARLEGESEGAVRAAAIEALGNLRAVEAVRPLRDRLGEGGADERHVLFALARIRSEAARDALLVHGALVERAERSDAAEIVRLVDFLLSDAFVEQERVIRRLRERPGR